MSTTTSGTNRFKPPERTDPVTGRVLEPWEQSLKDYLLLKPPRQEAFWARAHLAAVAGAVRLGKLRRSAALEDYTAEDLKAADKQEALLTAPIRD